MLQQPRHPDQVCGEVEYRRVVSCVKGTFDSGKVATRGLHATKGKGGCRHFPPRSVPNCGRWSGTNEKPSLSRPQVLHEVVIHHPSPVAGFGTSIWRVGRQTPPFLYLAGGPHLRGPKSETCSQP